jgi:hypothetical protein
LVTRFENGFNTRDLDALITDMTEDCVFEHVAPAAVSFGRHEGQAAVPGSYRHATSSLKENRMSLRKFTPFLRIPTGAYPMSLRSAPLAALIGFALAGCATDLPTSNLAADAVPQFITYGALDGDAHPHVGLMVAKDAAGAPMWRCSGTLLSSKLFLTAGHCTAAPAASVEIWFEADVQSGLPGNGYPFTGEVSGTPYTHPDYNPNAFYLADVGVVVLDEPVMVSRYGQLPALNSVETLATRRGLQNTSFRAVGYGLQRINPVFSERDLIRMVATPHLVQINSGLTGRYSLLLSNNAATGGTCYGDSGGPNFLGDTDIVAGVTSFGMNGNCAGTGGVYRMDRAAPLDWVRSTFSEHLN